MIRLSEEQEAVATKVVAEGRNVVSISKPGTGKSTLAFEIARRRAGRTLVLTYNSKLKEEGRVRVARLGLGDRVEVHSFHAAALQFFDVATDTGADDGVLVEALQAVARKFAPFDLVVIDEAQDMTPLFYRFVVRLLEANGPTQMLIVGDPFQRINAYLGASWQYMNMPQAHFGHLLRDPSFVELHLTICFRITPEMADWVNEHLDPRKLQHCVDPIWWQAHGELISRWWSGGVRSGKEAAPGSVRVFREGVDDAELVACVEDALAEYPPEDCVVLTSTLRTPKPTVATLMHSMPDVLWAVASDQSISWEGAADAVGLHKVAVTTVHRFKGLERRMVVVTELDSSRERGDDPLDVFAYFFVALTRAQELMLIVCGASPYATMRQTAPPPTTRRKPRPTELTSILRHVPFDKWLSVPMSRGGFVDKMALNIDKGLIEEDRIEACRFVQTNGGVEDAAPYLEAAVMWLTADVLRVPSDGTRREMRKAFGPELDDEGALRPQQALKFAVAERARARRFPHIWKQHRGCSVELAELLRDMADVAIELLTYLGAEAEGTVLERFPTDLSVDVTCIKCIEHYCKTLDVREGRPFLLRSADESPTEVDESRKVVHLCVTPSLRHEDILKAALWGAFDAVSNGKTAQCTPSFIVVPNLGTIYEVAVHGGDDNADEGQSGVEAPEILVRTLLRKHGVLDPQLIEAAIEEFQSAPRLW